MIPAKKTTFYLIIKKIKLFFLIIVLFPVFIIFSCMPKDKVKQVDLFITNATIYTVDPDFSVDNSMVIDNGLIVETGDSVELGKKYKARKILDFDDAFIYPGFIDAHCHFYQYANNLLTHVDLTGTLSFDDIIGRLSEFNSKHQPKVLVGRGWDQNDWTDKEFPDKSLLDAVFPDIPVILFRIDGHAVLVNSKVIELANISPGQKIDGGEIVMENGELSGILVDNAMDLVHYLIPGLTTTEQKQALLIAQKNCFAVGLTGVHDAGLEKDEILLIDSLQKTGELRMRVYAMLSPTQSNISYFVSSGHYKTSFLNVRSIKLYADGALGSRGARLIEPYSDDPDNYGLLVNDTAYFEKYCRIAYENNFQVSTHAIGDFANRFVLNMYKKNLPADNDLRWRIEHAQIVHPQDVAIFGDYNIIPSVQPTHATSDMYWAESRLGLHRMHSAYAYKTLLEQNGWIAHGSDFPIESINPLYGFYAATIRKDQQGFPENGFMSKNALTRKQALKAMTIWAARAAFEDHEKGSLEPGKLADFVVTDTDILKTRPEDMLKCKVIQTFIAGEEVYKNRGN